MRVYGFNYNNNKENYVSRKHIVAAKLNEAAIITPAIKTTTNSKAECKVSFTRQHRPIKTEEKKIKQKREKQNK